MKTTQSTSFLKIPAGGTKLFYKQITDLLQNPLAMICGITKKYGGIVQVRILHKKFIIIENPEHFKYILQEEHKNFYKYDLSGLLTKFLGNGLVTSNGQTWLQQRRIIQPAFHKQQLESMVIVIHYELDKLIASLKKEPAGKSIDICRHFMELNIRIITRMLFGETIDSEFKTISGILNNLTIQASKQITQFIKLPLAFPSPANIRFTRAKKKFDALIYTVIKRRKKQIAEGTTVQQDILQMLLTSGSKESPTPISDKQIRDELTTLFMAGYETTSQTLGWLFYQVVRQPEIAASIRAEINDTIQDKMVTVHDLARLSYTTNVIKETLRFYPSIWLLVRKNFSNDALGQFYLPKQSVILLNLYGMHHNETYWEQPEEFNPDRFNAANTKERHPYTYLPFGTGPRSCIGQAFAMMLMQIVVSRLISAFECKPVESFEATMESHITLKPKPTIYVQLIAIPEP